MADEQSFKITIDHVREYEFKVRFDWQRVPQLLLDEPRPLGGEHGPNAVRILAAAVGNCLSASLLFCMRKAKVEPGNGITTEVTGRLVRTERGRLRVGGLDVRMRLDGVAASSRLRRCLELFEDYCVVTESVRAGLPVSVQVLDAEGHPMINTHDAVINAPSGEQS